MQTIPPAFRSGFVERRCVPGLGLLALDDVFGLHAQAVNAALSTSVANCSLSDPPSVTLQDLQFGMAANRSGGHTVEWAVYATGAGCTTDPYYCFVNAAREDLGVNTLPIAGNGIINAMRWGQRLEPLGYGSGEYTALSTPLLAANIAHLTHLALSGRELAELVRHEARRVPRHPRLRMDRERHPVSHSQPSLACRSGRKPSQERQQH